MRWWLLVAVASACTRDSGPAWCGWWNKDDPACTDHGVPAPSPSAGSATIELSNPVKTEVTPAAPPKRGKKDRRGGGGGGGRSSDSTSIDAGEAPRHRHGFANGVACTFDSDCASDECSFNTCASKSGDKKLGNGVECTFDSDCASGECSFNKCASKSGDKQLGTGVACTFDSDCASGECSFDKCADRD